MGASGQAVMADWHWDRSRPRPSEGQGAWARRGEDLGYAKLYGSASEMLGAKLGKLVQVSVANVELGSVEGQAAVISRVRSVATVSLAEINSSDVRLCGALKKASGLIPFLLWIGSGDHGKPENFVATPDERGNLELEAIDFGCCFEWRDDGLGGVAILPELTRNADSQQVERTLQNIENVSDTTIQDACKSSGMLDHDQMAAGLIRRKHLLREWLRSLLQAA